MEFSVQSPPVVSLQDLRLLSILKRVMRLSSSGTAAAVIK